MEGGCAYRPVLQLQSNNKKNHILFLLFLLETNHIFTSDKGEITSNWNKIRMDEWMDGG